MSDKNIKVLPAPRFAGKLPPKPEVSGLQSGVRADVAGLLPEGGGTVATGRVVGIGDRKSGMKDHPDAIKQIPAGKYFNGEEIIVPSLEKTGKGLKGVVIGFDKSSDFYSIRMSNGPQSGQTKYIAASIIKGANHPWIEKAA
jgi:hypothetical protein